MTAPRRAWVVGLGTIARTHLEVLSERSDVVVELAVDPAPREAVGFPVEPTWTAAMASGAPLPALVVVATPTATHVPLVAEVLATTDARVLCEKPVARRGEEVAQLRTRYAAAVLADRLRVAHHFAFSPEVLWACDLVAAHPEWGPPRSVVSAFNDPYGHRSEVAASLVSPWVDSGPNQLSMLARFVEGWEVVDQATTADRQRSVTALRFAGGLASLVTSWVAGDSSKQTSLTFTDGTEIRLDHTAMTGLVLRGARVLGHLGYAGRVARKAAHYRGLYDDVLGPAPSRYSSFAMAVEVAELLEAAERAGAGTDLGGAVTWSEVRSAGE